MIVLISFFVFLTDFFLDENGRIVDLMIASFNFSKAFELLKSFVIPNPVMVEYDCGRIVYLVWCLIVDLFLLYTNFSKVLELLKSSVITNIGDDISPRAPLPAS